jgi:hypothetical protein
LPSRASRTLNDTVSIVTSPSGTRRPGERRRRHPQGTPVNVYRAGRGRPRIRWHSMRRSSVGLLQLRATRFANLGPVSPACVDPGSSSARAHRVRREQVKGPSPPRSPSLDVQPTSAPTLRNCKIAVASTAAPLAPSTRTSTGGYYQPVSVFLPRRVAALPRSRSTRRAMKLRVRGGGRSPPPVLLQGQYHLNVNPQVASVTVVQDDAGGTRARWTTRPNKTNCGARRAEASRSGLKWPACPLD